jgi:DNA-binding response OmpR family regulator
LIFLLDNGRHFRHYSGGVVGCAAVGSRIRVPKQYPDYITVPRNLRPILLIDDNPLQLMVRETVLRKAGFQVSVATTADSALATMRALPNRFGLVITDHLMPGTTGSGLVRQMRAEQFWLPVLVLSGLAEAEPEYQGLDVSFRVKPFPPEKLIELVQTLLENDGEQRGAA